LKFEAEGAPLAFRVIITRFRKRRGVLTKTIHLKADGSLGNDSSQCRMSDGEAERVVVNSAEAFAALINNLSPNQSLAIGQLRPGLPDRVRITIKAKLDPNKPDTIARTLDYLTFAPGEPAWFLGDVDMKGVSEAAAAKLKEYGGVFGALARALIGFDKCAMVWRASTSSELVDTRDGKPIAGSGGYHVYIAVDDGAVIPDFAQRLADRLTLMGLAWGMTSACGSFLKRCLIDVFVASPERLVFEAAPLVLEPLKQGPRPAHARPGVLLDSRQACPPPTAVERQAIEAFWKAESERLAPEMARKRDAWIEGHVQKLVAKGEPRALARMRVAAFASDDLRTLMGAFPLVFDNPKIGETTVGAVVANPKKFDGKTLSDPVEGPPYGAGVAEFYANENGSCIVHSFAHGGAVYKLVAEPTANLEDEVERLARMLRQIDRDREMDSVATRLKVRVTTLAKLVKAKIAELFPPNASAAQRAADEINADHCVVKIGAQTRVLCFETTPHYAGGERYLYRIPVYLKFDDFKNFYLDRLTIDGQGRPFATDRFGAALPLGHWWVKSPLRRKYSGVVFIPGGRPIEDDRLNLWTGFAVKPARGDWSLMREHIRVVLAQGDQKQFEYIFNWHADMFQYPNRQAEAAVVLRGGQGTGKGMLGRAICRLLGQHARHISSPEHLTGKFNAHFQQCIFLFADEAVAPDDRKAEGRLKRLITEDTLFIEPKGIDPFETTNFLHVMQATNHQYAVPAEEKERRYFVSDVDPIHQGDHAYFNQITRQLRDGG
jgi:hypothetical protein